MSYSSTASLSDPGSPLMSYSDAEQGLDYHATASKSSPLLSEDPFSSEASQRLFNAIDELRRCGAGQDLDLPQLVIAGKQSAGKSSLLKSLTDIPFPVREGLCTRFATRIISRRTPPGTADTVHVSIEQGDIDAFGEGNDLQAVNFDRSIPSLTPEVFDDIVKEASECMGIQTKDRAGRRNFSSKVLKIELSGPTRSHFGILDLPGIFSATRKGISAQEMNGVTEIVTEYMQKKENIIICVADATDDLSNQKIFDLASDYGDNSRIVGVFTKCDITQHPEQVVKIVTENQDISLDHGWFVVQNSGPKGSASFDHKKEESATFSQLPWSNIPAQQRGTAMFKKFLAHLLCRRIRETFPTMQRKIGELLDQENCRLAQLGSPRPDHKDHQKHLFSIAEKFRSLSHQALKSPEELPSDDMKLCGLAKRARDNFAQEIEEEGHYYKFSEIGESQDATNLQGDTNSALQDSRGGLLNPGEYRSSKLRNGALTPDSSPVRGSRTKTIPKKKETALYDEIRTQIFTNHGGELPCMTNPKVLKPLFRKQSSKWEGIGEAYLRMVVAKTSNVAAKLLKEVCAELGVRSQAEDELRNILFNFKNAKEKELMDKLHVFFQENSTFPLQTSNKLFTQKVQEAQNLRFHAALERYRKRNPPEKFIFTLGTGDGDRQALDSKRSIFSPWAIVNTKDLTELFEQMNPRGVQNTEDEIHDLLKAYYEVARDEYVSYVTSRIVEPFLHDERGPLFGLSTDFILGLDEEVVKRLGGEDESVTIMRKETEIKITRLKQAMRIADRALRMRYADV